MHVLHLDTETHPVTQDDPAPPPICLQWCIGPEPEIRQGAASPFLPHGENGLEFDAPIGSGIVTLLTLAAAAVQLAQALGQ